MYDVNAARNLGGVTQTAVSLLLLVKWFSALMERVIDLIMKGRSGTALHYCNMRVPIHTPRGTNHSN